jgi:hypothetical protein
LLGLLFGRFGLGVSFEAEFLLEDDDFFLKLINLEIDFKHFLLRIIGHFIDVIGVVDKVLVEDACC